MPDVQINNSIATAIATTLKYYAIFRYPLRAEEVHRYCAAGVSMADVHACLDELLSTQQVFSWKGYYSPSPEVEKLVERREQGNREAKAKIVKAGRVGRFIYLFPFVRFVGISGSLSKGYADSKSDFDFFIVTAERRLWICRTLLHLFKKLTFLAGQQHKFCMNYFVDETHVQLEEQNIYTATELASLIPICGQEVHRELLLSNRWMLHHIPHFKPLPPDRATSKPVWLKSAAEWCFDRLGATSLNMALMRFTDNRWRKKWARKQYPSADYSLAFKTTPHVSKNHPANYQKKILEQLTGKKA